MKIIVERKGPAKYEASCYHECTVRECGATAAEAVKALIVRVFNNANHLFIAFDGDARAREDLEYCFDDAQVFERSEDIPK